MSGTTTPSASTSSDGGSGPYQTQLANYCRSRGVRGPSYQIVSDKRGGRTAWSCKVFVLNQEISARFWYDGERVNQSREDASEEALVRLGAIARTGLSPAQTVQMAQQTGSNGGQRRQYAPARG